MVTVTSGVWVGWGYPMGGYVCMNRDIWVREVSDGSERGPLPS